MCADDRVALNAAWGDGSRFVPAPLDELDRDWMRWAWQLAIAVAMLVGLLIIAILAIFSIAATATPALARDDGRYAGSALKSWFDQLASRKGLCCSFADGWAIEDADWDVAGGHYRVRIEGQWVDVPDEALVTVPNRFGRAVVWPTRDETGAIGIRCFMPGSGV